MHCFFAGLCGRILDTRAARLRLDHLITLEKKSGRTYLKSWQLSSGGFKIKSAHEFDGEYSSAAFHKNNILAFVLLRERQGAVVLYDTLLDHQVVKINIEEVGYPYSTKITMLEGYSFMMSISAEGRYTHSRSKYNNVIYSGSDWNNVKLNPYKFWSFGGVVISGEYILSRTANPEVNMRSIANPSVVNYADGRPPYPYVQSPVISSAEADGAFLDISGGVFRLNSVWKTLLDSIPLNTI